jgi:hypothetical protein
MRELGTYSAIYDLLYKGITLLYPHFGGWLSLLWLKYNQGNKKVHFNFKEVDSI